MQVTVVGAGVFGAWTAKFLTDAGHAVTLVDAYGPANGRASSADHTRVLRAGYGRDEIYSRWASEALADWRWLAAAVGRELWVQTGALFLGPAGHAYVRETYETLSRLAIAAEHLTGADVERRYPQMTADDVAEAVYEPGAGVIRARAAVQALVEWLQRERGVRYVLDRVEPLDEQRARPLVRAAGEGELTSDAYVFACGPWLPAVLPSAVGGRIRPTRQEVLHFGVPAGVASYSTAHLPVWIDFAAGLYGIPDIDARGFKVGIDRHGANVDPDTLERIVPAEVVHETRAWIGRRFPGLREAPLVDARVCQYENTSTGDFLIDRHPQWANCVIAGGGSGHGFKHGPAVGRHVAALVSRETEPAARFSLAAKGSLAARAVY